MMRNLFTIVVILFGCWIGSAHAEGATIGSLKISNPWARATPKGASVGGAYMTITNTGNLSDRLTGGSSDVSGRFEIHEMSMENGVMKMRPLESGLEIKSGQTLEFKPGGYHVMFVGLKRSLEEGQHVKATLKFERAGNIAVDFIVESIGAQNSDTSSGKMQMQHGH